MPESGVTQNEIEENNQDEIILPENEVDCLCTSVNLIVPGRKTRIFEMEVQRHCCVPDCSTVSSDDVFHEFPKDESLKKKWMKAYNITTKVMEDVFVCTLHLKEMDYLLGKYFVSKLHSSCPKSCNFFISIMYV